LFAVKMEEDIPLVSVTIVTGQGLSFRLHMTEGEGHFSLIQDVAEALGMSIDGFRGYLSRHAVSTVQNNRLKQLLGLSGKVRFLTLSALEQVLRDRLSSNHQVLEAALARLRPNNRRAPVVVIDVSSDDDDQRESTSAAVSPPVAPVASSLPVRPEAPLNLRNRFLNLGPITEDLQARALEHAVQFSQSTERKMQLAFRAWSHVCKVCGWNPEDTVVPDERLIQFVYVCLHKDYGIRYGLYSFRDVYVPMLLRYFESRGFQVGEGVHDRIKNRIKSMVRGDELDPSQMPQERGQEPIMRFDVSYIASMYPPGCSDRAQVLAWLSLGVHTGVRGVSLTSTYWEDVRIVELPQSDWKQVTVVFRKTKHDPNWNHVVTVEGSTSFRGWELSGCDPVFWMAHLVKEALGDPSALLSQQSVEAIARRANSEESRLLLGCESQSRMSERIETVGRYCGYPERYLTAHGTRAAFLAEALLSHSTEPGKEVNITDVWTKCALVAGWKVGSTHMQSYVRQALLRCIVGSRLVGAGALQASRDEEIVAVVAGVGAIAKNRLTPRQFHGLDYDLASRCCWPEMTTSQVWVEALSRRVRNVVRQERPDLQGNHLEQATRFVCTHFYRRLAKTQNLFVIEEGSPVDFHTITKLSKRAVKRWVTDQLVKRGAQNHPREWIDAFLNQAEERLVILASSYEFNEDLSQSVTKAIAAKKDKKRPRRKVEKDEGEETGVDVGGGRTSKRIAWSDEETAALCKGVLQFGASKWAQIRDCPALSQRSNMNCKDRMRTLAKQLARDASKPDYTEVAKVWLEQNEN
jgi:hypothetical protein